MLTLKSIFPKKSLHLYLEQKTEKRHSKNIDLQKNTGPQSFFETEMLSALYPCKKKCSAYVFMLRFDQGLAHSDSV